MRLRLAAVAGGVALADQLTKQAVVGALAPGESVPVIDGVLYLTHVRNAGAAFGLLRGLPGLIGLAALAGLVVVIVVLARDPGPLVGTGAALVAGGALGNLLDRAFRPWPFRGTVVDFVDFRVWPAFNVADAAITAGVALLLVASVRERGADTGADEDAGG